MELEPPIGSLMLYWISDLTTEHFAKCSHGIVASMILDRVGNSQVVPKIKDYYPLLFDNRKKETRKKVDIVSYIWLLTQCCLLWIWQMMMLHALYRCTSSPSVFSTMLQMLNKTLITLRKAAIDGESALI